MGKSRKFTIRYNTIQDFLVACTQLYTSLYWSVGLSVGPSEITLLFLAFRAERRSDLSYCPCPTTVLLLPTHTQLMLPCIVLMSLVESSYFTYDCMFNLLSHQIKNGFA